MPTPSELKSPAAAPHETDPIIANTPSKEKGENLAGGGGARDVLSKAKRFLWDKIILVYVGLVLVTAVVLFAYGPTRFLKHLAKFTAQYSLFQRGIIGYVSVTVCILMCMPFWPPAMILTAFSIAEGGYSLFGL